MSDLTKTLEEINRIEKSAGSEDLNPVFNKEPIAKAAEAGKAYLEALEAVEKAQTEEIMKTSAGRASAVIRAAILSLEGAMSIIWEANGMDDTARSQVQNASTLLAGLTTEDVEKGEKKPTEASGEEVTTAKGETAADQAEAAGKNTPEGQGQHGDPANPDDVEWPADMNSQGFRGNAKPEENAPGWGRDGEQPPA